jgi:hypothetical protein
LKAKLNGAELRLSVHPLHNTVLGNIVQRTGLNDGFMGDTAKVLNFEVTDEMLKTNHNKLSQFEFLADDRNEYRAETGVVAIQS